MSMSETTVLFNGGRSEKIVRGGGYSGKYFVTPFAGVANYIGIGIIIHDAAPRTLKDTKGNVISETDPVYHFEGDWSGNNLVAAYRGMQIVQEMPVIELGRLSPGTLGSCYGAAIDILKGRHPHWVEIEARIVGEQKLEGIMNSQLPSDEFDGAIIYLQLNGKEFDIEPLIRELNRGTLQRTPTLDKLVADYAVQQVAKQQPVPARR